MVESCSFLNVMNIANDVRTEWVPTELMEMPTLSGPMILTAFLRALVIAEEAILKHLLVSDR